MSGLSFCIQDFSVHRQIMALRFKNAFSPFHLHKIVIFFKTMHTFKFLNDRPVSICQVKCLDLLCTTRTCHWLSVTVNLSFWGMYDGIAAVTIKRILHECSCFIEFIKRVGKKR